MVIQGQCRHGQSIDMCSVCLLIVHHSSHCTEYMHIYTQSCDKKTIYAVHICNGKEFLLRQCYHYSIMAASDMVSLQLYISKSATYPLSFIVQ